MEKGQMRVEANISVSDDPKKFGIKVEVKNLNSFRSVERAIAYEIERQKALLERGEKVAQETRGWDEVKAVTFSQRKKEESHDYRYFPEPDLPGLTLSEVPELSKEELAKSLPELPWQKRERYRALGFLQEQDIEQLIGDAELASLFGEVERKLTKPELVKIAANFVLNDIAGKRKQDIGWSLPTPDFLASIVQNFHDGTIASPQAKSSIVSGVMVKAADANELPTVARKIINDNPSVVGDYKAGKEGALQFLVGQGMKETKGSANPQKLRTVFEEILNSKH